MSADAPGGGGLRLKRLLLLVLVPAVCGVAGLFAYLQGGRYVETDNAYLKADKMLISVQVPGTISEAPVQDNQPVRAGELLFRLHDATYRVAVARARANLAKVRADLAALKASYREKLAEIALARTSERYLRKEHLRQADLAQRGFISSAKLDETAHRSEEATRQIERLEQDLRRIGEELAGGPNTRIETHPLYLAAEAELEQARLDLGHAQVHAPMAGTVGNRPRPGQYVSPGMAVMSLVGSGEPWVEANFSEADLTHVRPGQPARIRIDTYPDLEWRGVVESLSPATGAEFSVIPAQNATGNWVKVVQRVPVRIRIEPNGHSPALRAGLSTWVEIDTGHRRRVLGWGL